MSGRESDSSSASRTRPCVCRRDRLERHVDRALLSPRDVSVTFDHDILVDFFRHQPRLAAELLRRCADRDLQADDVELVSIDLSQVVPIEYRADALVVLRDANGKASHAIVVEVQLAREQRKRYTWPVYLAVTRAQLECPGRCS